MHRVTDTWYDWGNPWVSKLLFICIRILHVQLCSEFTLHYTYSLVLNLVPGILSGTKRDCTCTTRVIVEWIHHTTTRGIHHPWNELGDIEIKDFVFLTRVEDNCLSPHLLILDVTMTHGHYGRTTQHTNETITHRISSDGTPQPWRWFEKYGQEEITFTSVLRGSDCYLSFLLSKDKSSFIIKSIKWELEARPIYDCRCDERLEPKDDESFRIHWQFILPTWIDFSCSRIKKRRKPRVKIVTLKLCWVWKSR